MAGVSFSFLFETYNRRRKASYIELSLKKKKRKPSNEGAPVLQCNEDRLWDRMGLPPCLRQARRSERDTVLPLPATGEGQEGAGGFKFKALRPPLLVSLVH